MASFLRWVFLFVAALVLTALFEPPIMAFFAKQGWHDGPNEIAGDFLNWMSEIVGISNFPWIAGGVLGLTCGAWVHWLASKLETRKPSKSDQFSDLYSLIHSVGNQWFDGFKDDFGEVDFTGHNYQTDLRRKVLYEKLKKVGIMPPDFSDMTERDANLGHYAFMQCLGPFAQHGLLAEAKREATKTVSEIKAASERLRLNQGSE